MSQTQPVGNGPSTQPSRLQLWREVCAETEDAAERGRAWTDRMIGFGLLREDIYAAVTVHRVLAGHGTFDRCEDCPCDHCGRYESDPDGDHSCPCPYSDQDCEWHTWARRTPPADRAGDERD